ncbi:DUF6868 family protein [Phycobacter sp. K97]|uniref:DUF6868 family protein n=1 Tax=Phycobacter sedimenti TaxID=3133977 RepID=UPI00311DE523
MSQDTLVSLFGWLTALNLAFLMITSVLLVSLRDRFAALHASLFDLDLKTVKAAYFSYLATYKILTFIFCLMPYLALRLI